MTGSGIWITACAGGISGLSYGKIENCYNNAVITAKSLGTYTSQTLVGGIVGDTDAGAETEISNCYNTGNITSSALVVTAGGILGATCKRGESNPTIKNLYNIGEITVNASESGFPGAIIGRNGWGSTGLPTNNIKNIFYSKGATYSYYQYNNGRYITTTEGKVTTETLKTYSTMLGDAFTDDVQNEDGTWKYNNGYPILKWQLEEN